LVFGKAVITNNDGSAQGVSAKLQAHDSSLLLDQTDVKIEGNTTQCMSVQKILTVNGSETIHISCSTFKGSAFDAQLMAVAVDTIVPVKE
jgi:hypothetical protein